MNCRGVNRDRADLEKCGFSEIKFSLEQSMFVKLHRPPPEMTIFRPTSALCSRTATLRPRFPASIAQNRPAAPPPITIASYLIKRDNALLEHSGGDGCVRP